MKNTLAYLKRIQISREAVRPLILILLFSLFLTPFSITIRGDNVSANYLFIFFPLILLLLEKKITQPSAIIKTIISIYLFIFLICLIYQIEYYIFWERRVISFTLFMSMFAFMFVKIDHEMLMAFKKSIILVSIIYSINSLASYFMNGGSALGYELMRPLVQSQRYGFVLIFGFWLTVLYPAKSMVSKTLKILMIFIIFNGLGLTFSRSSIAGLLVSTTTLALVYLIKYKYKILDINAKALYTVLVYIFSALLIALISYIIIPDYFEYFSQRLLKINITAQRDGFFPFPTYPLYNTTIYNPSDSSEGYRVFMIGEVFNYILTNPLFGSGFLGVWVMFDHLFGASHNQLLDILFRTGIIGFSCFIYLIFKIIKFNYNNNDIATLISIAAILAIGIFHETFKLSQGAFIIAFLASLAFSKTNQR
jgi:hypothetical protein